MGCETKPNLDAEMALMDKRFHFKTNSTGLRNAEVEAKKPGWKRVLVLGDSVTFAPQVADDAPFPNLLDRDLFKDNVDVVNGGFIYLRATDQQLSWFLDVGSKLAPDLVLVEFTERNDFADNQHEYWWKSGPKGLERQLNVQAPTYHPWVLLTNTWPMVPWLDTHSRLFGLFRVGFWNIMHLPRIDTDKRWTEATEGVMARLKQEVESRGARLAVVLHPSPERLAGTRGEQELRKDNDNARIVSILTTHQIPYLDLGPLLSPESARTWIDEGHLTTEGHLAVAKALLPQIRTWLAP
jgi:lysophospholipase L1-like esterase